MAALASSVVGVERPGGMVTVGGSGGWRVMENGEMVPSTDGRISGTGEAVKEGGGG